MWEDVKNVKGGRWLLNLERKDKRDLLDPCWLETVSAAIVYKVRLFSI